MRTLGLVIGLLLAGCASEKYVDCEIDVTFSSEATAEIQRAAKDWRAFASERTPRVVDGGEWLIVEAPVPGGWLGYAQGKRKLIRIDPDTPPGEVYAVALHELGHALGLEHVSRGVMNKAKQTVEFSDEDATECRRAGACG